MSAVASISKGLGKGGWPLLIGVATVAFVVVHYILKKDITDTKDAVGQAISGATETVGAIATGKNSLTANTEYYGAGIPGTLGAATDAALGNVPSQIGDWIGGKLYDFFGDSSAGDNSSSATGNPYSPTGPSAGYADAANNSPVNAQYRASPLTIYGADSY